MLAQRAARAEASPGTAKTNHRTLCKGAWHQSHQALCSTAEMDRRDGGGGGDIFSLNLRRGGLKENQLSLAAQKDDFYSFRAAFIFDIYSAW